LRSGPANQLAQDKFNDVRKALREGRIYSNYNVAVAFLKYNLDARILMDLLGSPGGLFHAYFEGERFGDMLFVLDPLGAPFVAPEEVALVGLRDGSLGIWMAEHISDHYRSTSFFDEDHSSIEIEHYNIEATIRGKRLEAIARIRFRALADGPRVIPFDLFSSLRAQGRRRTGPRAELRRIKTKVRISPW
jgi:hypothetical protein